MSQRGEEGGRGLVDEACSRGEETVPVSGGFGPDGPQPLARGEGLKETVSGVGGVGHNLTCTGVQILPREAQNRRCRKVSVSSHQQLKFVHFVAQ